MAKNIIVCSDGTGNAAIKGRGTNVFKLYESLDLTSHRTDPHVPPQVAFYDDGVGTEDFKPLKILGGAAGVGLSRNVRQLYTEIVRVYDPGDRIFLFGFSRGAFTVRTLAGFIGKCGLLDPSKPGLEQASQLDRMVKKAYSVYRRCYRPRLAEMIIGKDDGTKTQEFSKQYCHPGEVRIAFIGVWDTVDAVGLPFHLADVLNAFVYRFKFPDLRLSAKVDRACHALAIDDERHSFSPVLWDESGGEQRIEQVWFSGAHSNIGGGYPKHGMSLVTLDWMMSAAEKAGVRFIPADRQFYREHANVDDKLYDPRAGLGIFYRWKPRDIAELCSRCGVRPKLHLSVLERVAHGSDGYAPGNLPFHSDVVFTADGRALHGTLLQQRAQHTQSVLNGVFGKSPEDRSFRDEVRKPIFAGLVAYYVYLVTLLLAVGVAAGSITFTSPLDPSALLRNLGTFVWGLMTNFGPTARDTALRLWADPKALAVLAVGFGVAYLMTRLADSRMSSVFSRHWHRIQPDLRQALKAARAEEAQAQAPREVPADRAAEELHKQQRAG